MAVSNDSKIGRAIVDSYEIPRTCVAHTSVQGQTYCVNYAGKTRVEIDSRGGVTVSIDDAAGKPTGHVYRFSSIAKFMTALNGQKAYQGTTQRNAPKTLQRWWSELRDEYDVKIERRREDDPKTKPELFLSFMKRCAPAVVHNVVRETHQPVSNVRTAARAQRTYSDMEALGLPVDATDNKAYRLLDKLLGCIGQRRPSGPPGDSYRCELAAALLRFQGTVREALRHPEVYHALLQEWFGRDKGAWPQADSFRLGAVTEKKPQAFKYARMLTAWFEPDPRKQARALAEVMAAPPPKKTPRRTSTSAVAARAPTPDNGEVPPPNTVRYTGEVPPPNKPGYAQSTPEKPGVYPVANPKA